MMMTVGRFSADNKSNRKGKFKRFLLVNNQVGEKFMKRVSIFDGLEIRVITASLFATAVVFACLPQSALAQEDGADTLDAPPFRAYPVTCGITFTYAGLRVDKSAAVLNTSGEKITGLYACGELIGDIFSAGYPGGSGLTSGAVFGRIAGRTAARG